MQLGALKNALGMQNTYITDRTTGETATVTSGGLDVNVQDQNTNVIDFLFTAAVQAITISTNTTLDSRSVVIGASTAPTVGNYACFKEGDNFYQGQILAQTGSNPYTLTLDTPLDFAFTTAGGCSERNANMAVDGSSTPVEFTITPSGLTSGMEWDMTRVMITITDSTVMDDAKFGGISALTNGVYLRMDNTHSQNLMNIKTNEDWRLRAYDLEYSDKAPSGSYGLGARKTYAGQSKSGVTIRLSEATDDELKFIIQDDLTGLDTFYAVGNGHVVE